MTDMKLERVPVNQILARQAPDAPELAMSLGELGQRDPINVRPITGKGLNSFKYEIASGNRRYWSLVNSGAEDVWCVIIQSDDTSFHLDTLTLNAGTPNYMDEADSIKALIQDDGFTKEQIANSTGMSNSTIQSRVDLYEKLIPEFQQALRDGLIKYSGTIELVKLPKHRQKKFWQAVQEEMEEGERTTISVRECQKAYRDWKEEGILQLLGDVTDTPEISSLSGETQENDPAYQTEVGPERTKKLGHLQQVRKDVQDVWELLYNHQWSSRTTKRDKEAIEVTLGKLSELLVRVDEYSHSPK